MKSASRRSFLRGAAGSMLALPCLDSLALAVPKNTTPAQRVAWFYVPIGVIRRGFFPGEENAGLAKFTGNYKPIPKDDKIPDGINPLNLTPTMKPLEKVRDKITLITGTDRTFKPGTDVHAQAASCFLSSETAVSTSAYPLSRTLDHIIADQIGGSTPFRSLEFSCNSHRDNKESIYFDNMSWYGTGHVAPSIRDPRKAYRRLFGTQEIKSNRNITDLVLEDAKSMRQELGQADSQKFAEYFDSIRTIEQQMDKLEKMKGELAKVSINEPAAARLPRGEYIRLMGDLMVVALQTGLTNVATFMVGPERWDTPFTFEALFDKPRSHHQMSHNQKAHVNDLLKIDHFHMQQFAYLVEKMDNIQEAHGKSLLDNTIFTYGSGLGDGATHQYTDLPIIVAGSGRGKLLNGKHLKLPKGTPLSNLWLTQAQAVGMNLNRYADSNGVVSKLIV